MPRNARRRDDLAAYGCLVALWLLMVVVANPWGEFPSNDDWVYALAVKSLLTEGVFRFPSPASANVGPQVFWGALFCLPFGFSFDALRLSTQCLGLAGVLLTYLAIRESSGDRRLALVGAVALAVNPLYFGLANNFMTDVPFLVVSLGAVILLARAIRCSSTPALVAGICLAVGATLIRQAGLALFAGFAMMYLMTRGVRLATLARALLMLLLGFAVHRGYQTWLLSSGRASRLGMDSHLRLLLAWPKAPWGIRFALADVVSYLGLFVLPFAVWVGWRPMALREGASGRRLRALLIGGTVLFALLLSVKGRWLPSADNVLLSTGLGPLTLRDTALQHLNVPSAPWVLEVAWKALTVLAPFAAMVAAVGLCRNIATLLREDEATRARHAQTLLTASTAVAYGMLIVLASLHFVIFDRYFLFLVPFVMVAMSARPTGPSAELPRGRAWAAMTVVLLFGAFSVAAEHDYAAWARTRWSALERLTTRDRVSPDVIDGGYEFNGWYLHDLAYRPTRERSWWWVRDDAYLVASGPVPGYTQVARYPYRRWMASEEAAIVVLRRTATR